MSFGPRKRNRRSIRLRGYDYGRPGAYFVTICVQGREFLFGRVVDGQMRLNAAGDMVWRWWHALPEKYPTVRTDAAVVMPNHFHGIIVIDGQSAEEGQPHGVAPTTADPVGATQGGRPQADGGVADGVGATQGGRPQADGGVADEWGPGQPRGVAPTEGDAHPTLGQIVGWFKTMTTNEYIRGVRERGWPPFPGKVWQRNYYEHIVRNRQALERIRTYVETNPERWAWDRENPECLGPDVLELWIFGRPEAGT
jgi:REP element-mobilizing transposase RayT